MSDDILFIGHMLEMAQRAKRLVDGLSRPDLDQDEKLQLALVRALQVIGEAAWRTSAEFQRSHADVPWKKIAAFRHRVVHEYFAVDYDIVWRIATEELQPLIEKLEPLLPQP
ncbi:MAG TPA: HepT-like ribonuclease domain-containing protein [Tepidisphaeraceae bacterium]|nr:HepT-like ribonuclease domain-containing protein [Tepidisphaeraceae bacterium]